MKSRGILTALALTFVTFLTLFAVGYFVPVYRMETDTWAEALCDTHECTIFVTQGHHGWAMRAFPGLIAAVVQSFLTLPSEHAVVASTTVLSITANSFRHYDFPGQHLDPDGIFDGALYFGSARKWVDGHLQLLSPDEQARFADAKTRGLTQKPYWGPQPGWTARILAGAGSNKLETKLDGTAVALAFVDEDGDCRLEVARANTPPQTVWRLKGRQRFVTRRTYEDTFGPTTVPLR